MRGSTVLCSILGIAGYMREREKYFWFGVSLWREYYHLEISEALGQKSSRKPTASEASRNIVYLGVYYRKLLLFLLNQAFK